MIAALKWKWAQFCWHVNEYLNRHPRLMERLGLTLTVIDGFGTPGDTLLTASVCREIKRSFPKLRLNCETQNPSLIELDPNIDAINEKRGFCHIYFSYTELVNGKFSDVNVLQPTMDKLCIADFEYRADVYVAPDEIELARRELGDLKKPLIGINAVSREIVKDWPAARWRELIKRLKNIGTVVQIGDDREPRFDGVLRFAGERTLRESMALLSQFDVHIGPDSFLMHAASGLRIPSVIVYGGARPVGCLGYSTNVNLAVEIECSPCWIHGTKGETCPFDIKCMDMISPDQVFDGVVRQLEKARATRPIQH